MKLKATLLGTRGSVPVTLEQFAKYGGDTACVCVDAGDGVIILDAGTGLLRTPPEAWAKPLTILLSHTHVDHILGLPACPALYKNDAKVNILAVQRNGLSAAEQVSALMRPPLWPVTMECFAEGVQINDLTETDFMLNGVRITTMQGSHPGGCTVYRLQKGDSSLVYCTDFEHGQPHSKRLAEFAEGCSLLIYDAQYSKSEYLTKRGWGHSTWEQGILMAEMCGAERVALFHHDPTHDDIFLDEAQSRVSRRSKKCFFAKQGEVFELE